MTDDSHDEPAMAPDELQRLWLARHLPAAALLLAVATVVIRVLDLDLVVARRYYSPGLPHWPLETAPLTAWMYNWGNWLGLGLLAGALGVLVRGLLSTGDPASRRPAAFLLVLGLSTPGLLVNSVLKPYWNRARPRHVLEFGGQEVFDPVLSLPADHDHNSFPSGHVGSAALMVGPAFVLRRRHRRAARIALVLALGWTALMGLARIQAGGHWLSDCLWSLGLTYMAACLLGAWLLASPDPVERTEPPR